MTYLMDRLEFTPKKTSIAIHPTCSTRKMGLENAFWNWPGPAPKK